MYFWRISFYFGFSLSKSSVLDISESIEMQMHIQNDIKTLLSPLKPDFCCMQNILQMKYFMDRVFKLYKLNYKYNLCR